MSGNLRLVIDQRALFLARGDNRSDLSRFGSMLFRQGACTNVDVRGPWGQGTVLADFRVSPDGRSVLFRASGCKIEYQESLYSEVEIWFASSGRHRPTAYRVGEQRVSLLPDAVKVSGAPEPLPPGSPGSGAKSAHSGLAPPSARSAGAQAGSQPAEPPLITAALSIDNKNVLLIAVPNPRKLDVRPWMHIEVGSTYTERANERDLFVVTRLADPAERRFAFVLKPLAAVELTLGGVKVQRLQLEVNEGARIQSSKALGEAD